MIEPVKVNLPIVAAFLTIIGYSVNDTIVVFDRIREVRGKDPALTRKMVNDSTNQTLSRTLLTSFTVFLVVIVLYLAGGEALHGFAFALIVGVATGTYSSIYIAAPILLLLVGKHKEHGRSRVALVERNVHSAFSLSVWNGANVNSVLHPRICSTAFLRRATSTVTPSGKTRFAAGAAGAAMSASSSHLTDPIDPSGQPIRRQTAINNSRSR